MYPCPYCHTQLTWVPQYNQYYCYFCHRYVQAAGPPQLYQQAYAPRIAPQQVHQSPTAVPPDNDAPRARVGYTPRPVGDAMTPGPMQGHAAPPSQAPAKPAVEYAPKGSPSEPPSVPVSAQPSSGEPIYLCKLCGTRLEVNGQRWYCPRCQQYK